MDRRHSSGTLESAEKATWTAGEAIQGSNQKDPGPGPDAVARAPTACNPDTTW
jgi:hypothetical protein